MNTKQDGVMIHGGGVGNANPTSGGPVCEKKFFGKFQRQCFP